MRTHGIKKKCETCKGSGHSLSLPFSGRPTCRDCHGMGYIVYTDRPDRVDTLICSRIRPLSDLSDEDLQLLNTGEPMSKTEPDHVPLSDAEVAAIHRAAMRLSNTSNTKFGVVDHVKGTKGFIPSVEGDHLAKMDCEALNALTGILEPYGYSPHSAQKL